MNSRVQTTYDILERLRVLIDYASWPRVIECDLIKDAADEITRLRAELAEERANKGEFW